MIGGHNLLLMHTRMQPSMQMPCADANGVGAAPQR